MTKELMWYQQHFETGRITYNVRYSIDGQQPTGRDFDILEEDLLESAGRRRMTTWDQQDIIILHGTVYAEVISVAKQPTPSRIDIANEDSKTDNR